MKKELDKKYDPLKIEKNKYDFWIENKLFKQPLVGKPFSIILPPPNVTGKLHLGHAWDGTIQDVMIRFKRLNGYKVTWIPGTDHAGIATQTKFEKHLLTEKGLKKEDLGREKFIKELMVWKDEQSAFIHKQWAKLGLSLDYSKEKFTMDKDVNESVNKVFTELYNNKLIYKGKKLVNWDVKLQTAISDIEVIHKPAISKMYYFNYFLDDKRKKKIEVATTRPETMFGDVAVFVNPDDKRMKKIIGKKVLNPANLNWIPVLPDKYVDINFGTGAMKCTPAHDFNDHDLAIKHKLPIINIMNSDGTMNELAGKYKGIDRLECRRKLVKDLSKEGFVKSIDEKYETQIGYSERTDEIVEPYMSSQWFMKMKPIAKKVIDIQKKHKTDSTEFLPQRFDKTLLTWLNKIDDWCISRQLWWGHQIPIWHHIETNKIHVGGTCPKPIKEWVRETDVLDTWFSSALWPMVALDWQKSGKLFNEFFPTSILVTGYDIIFFWVSRMMMMSIYFTEKIPFKKVYIHGLIRDSEGKKMSKSLGNGIEPISIIDEYGADTLRLFLISSSTIGEDLNFSDSKIKFSWNYLNKLWNSARFIFSHIENKKYVLKSNDIPVISIWILNKLNIVIKNVTKSMSEYNFVVASKILYDFIWNDFCSVYIELSKTLINNSQFRDPINHTMLYVLKSILIMLHPFCPFITEEIYSFLPDKKISILKETWPSIIKIQKESITDILVSIINAIRRVRIKEGISNKEKIEINLLTKNDIKFFIKNKSFLNTYLIIVNANIKDISAISLLGSKVTEIVGNFAIEIPLSGTNEKKQIDKINVIIYDLKEEIDRSKKILSNSNFVSKAPKTKIDAEKEKLNSYEDKLKNAIEIYESLIMTREK